MSEIITPSILSGFMELLPEEQVLFDAIKSKIETKFQLYGYWPLDTPAIEKCEILFAKGGGETAKQVYRIDKGEHSHEQALRFDLTVPLARYVAQHTNELSFPFRRYHIAKVYRGERNQKGRYREFYQCDIDIIGRDTLSLINDAEIPAVIHQVFRSIGVSDAVFHINNRRLLNGMFEALKVEKNEEALRAIDKLAKIGEEAVAEMLAALGVSENSIKEIFEFIKPQKSNEVLIEMLDRKKAEWNNELFDIGVEELKEVYAKMQEFEVPRENIVLDLSITRGLDYYTGTVYETFLRNYEKLGSVCSGGRYDDLAKNFSKEHLPGVGISIGLTRLFYQLTQAEIIKPQKGDYISAIVLPMSSEDVSYSIKVVNELRRNNLHSLVYMEDGKVKKKFSYADNIGARYAIMIGGNERAENKISVKDLQFGTQDMMTVEEFIAKIN